MRDKDSIPKEAAEILEKTSTGMINDALALLGMNGGIRGVRPARGSEDARVLGRAATVAFGSPRPDSHNLTMYEAIRKTPAGSVLVIDGKGIDAHFTGDNQGECAKKQDLAGMVVYGGARDVAGYRSMGMPLYCTGSATVDKPPDIRIVGYNVPVEVGGVTVKPDDIIIADEDGVVCIPADALSATLEKLQVIFEVEEAMEKAIQGGASVDEIKAIIAKKKPRK
ncbi:MAG: RraA family protein [Syntrophales bacterium]